ncbi:winged helix-turn-helix domain-containing protein [Actinomadura sp. ATCC 31491]|uniref:Winged helix-turn-helix domain-containing protein n=1 Tax=Actinomadura luzonensis TaxID=2805427 RepID=A0ABT0G6A8_9ACTN|nr:winged helix-turn-helix domain-containing protein [Actinomadura luzonensis]MCK2220152.1 winged helix-turn-helix domain-containing protein [Actinomadura luzonensis]
MVTDALAGRRRGLPEHWRRTLSSRAGRFGHEAARPLGAPGRSIAPDLVVPLPPTAGDVGVRDQLIALRDTPPGALLADLERTFGAGPPPPHWQEAARRPGRWLHGYAGALAAAWEAAEPVWRRARPLLGKEVERVGVAAVRGTPELLLASLSGRVRPHPGGRGLLIADPEPRTYELGERPIVLVPMLAGRDALILGLDGPEAVWIAYPVPGAETLWRRPDTEAPDELSALIGPVRAELLHALEQPMTMSTLAAGLNIAPSGLTYHCDRLCAGRLITRERRGREVWIARTDRAEELLELFRQ